MAQCYGSFLLRCWRLDSGARRIAIEHIQSGARGQAATLAAAIAWIEAQSNVVVVEQTPLPGSDAVSRYRAPPDDPAGQVVGDRHQPEER